MHGKRHRLCVPRVVSGYVIPLILLVRQRRRCLLGVLTRSKSCRGNCVQMKEGKPSYSMDHGGLASPHYAITFLSITSILLTGMYTFLYRVQPGRTKLPY